MELIQGLLNSIIARLGVEQSVEFLLDEIQRRAYVAGFETRVLQPITSADASQLAHTLFEDWQYKESLKNIPPEAVSANVS
jgi:hypothetical protein